MAKNRFEVVHVETIKFPDTFPFNGKKLTPAIIKDKKTGVLYFHNDVPGNMGMATMVPMYDSDGKILVDKD